MTPVVAMFMTGDELHALTGYRQPTKQVAMLRRQGVPFHVNAAGHPKVARAAIEGRQQQPASPQPTPWSPSWGVNHR